MTRPPLPTQSNATSDREVINRSLWSCYTTNGDQVETKTTARSGLIEIEDMEGLADITVHVTDDGIDIRVGDLELIVKGRRVALLQKHPPYPIKKWSIMFQGEIA